MLRVIYCYRAEKLPHAGGFFDQPSTFVKLYMYLLAQVDEKAARDEAAEKAKRLAQGLSE